ncbi:MAG TPA: heparinase II/III family protein [Streptosporangiaceae bacterium]
MDMRLADCFTASRLAEHLKPWRPYPPVADRGYWGRVPRETRERLLAQTVPVSQRPWPLLTATAYGRYKATGDRQEYERPYIARRDKLMAAVITAVLTGDTSTAEITDGVWLLCEETSWCLPAHQPGGLPDPDHPHVDLFAAETAGLLAWTVLLTGEHEARVRREIKIRVLDPYLARDDWSWLGLDGRANLNNWTPWIHSNLLIASLLLDDRPNRVANRAVGALDRYLDSVPDDGGCDEGASYWWRAGASLFECLETLTEACGDDFGAFQLPKVRATARYPVVAHIAGNVHVNFADGSIRPPGVVPHLLYRFGARTGDAQVQQHAVAMREHAPTLVTGPNGALGRPLAAITDDEWAAAPPARFPAPLQSWLPATGVLTARERKGDTAGLFLAAKAGHNDESHNHNDVGSFIIALNGRPLLIDPGAGTYTRQTFGPDRYQIWTMQSSWHNTPAPAGHAQAAGRAHRATDVSAALTATAAELALDLAAAYPAAAGVRSWRRTLRLDRAAALISIHDSWELSHYSERSVCYLITREEPQVAGATITLPSGLVMDIDATPDGATADGTTADGISVERRDLDDPQLRSIWGEHLYRIILALPGQRGSLSTLVSRGEGRPPASGLLDLP